MGAGGEATIALVGDPQRMGEAARLHLELAVRMGAAAAHKQAIANLEVEALKVPPARGGPRRITFPASGLPGRPADSCAIEAVNNSGAPVLAVDLPSGIHAQDGRLLGTGGIRPAYGDLSIPSSRDIC